MRIKKQITKQKKDFEKCLANRKIGFFFNELYVVIIF